MEFFDNQWVIGIGGGVFSGLLVTLITRKFFASKDNREYWQRVKLANNEVVYAIKPFIVDGEVPDLHIIASMQSSTARKYGLDVSDMASLSDILEDLIKEIMDTSFISYVLKNQYCEKLSNLRPSLSDEEFIETYKDRAIVEYRQRVLTVFSTILGIFAGLVTMYTGIMASADESVIFAKVKIILPFFIALLMAYLALMFFKLSREKDLDKQSNK